MHRFSGAQNVSPLLGCSAPRKKHTSPSCTRSLNHRFFTHSGSIHLLKAAYFMISKCYVISCTFLQLHQTPPWANFSQFCEPFIRTPKSGPCPIVHWIPGFTAVFATIYGCVGPTLWEAFRVKGQILPAHALRLLLHHVNSVLFETHTKWTTWSDSLEFSSHLNVKTSAFKDAVFEKSCLSLTTPPNSSTEWRKYILIVKELESLALLERFFEQ